VPSPRPPAAPLPALPLEPRRYTQLLRGPRYRWWKPLLALALGSVLVVVLTLVIIVPPLTVGLVTGVPDLGSYIFSTLTDVDNLGPVGFLALNLSLIILIPAVLLSIWIVHGVRPRFVSSVTGGIRWRWLLTCLVVVLPIWVLYIGFGVLVDPTDGPRPAHWVGLLIVAVLTTPLQAAGEEYLFRGWLMQNVGAWFARPLVGLVVTTALSTALFALAHGSLDVWVLGTIGCFALAACLATWRTGGLEAGIAMHSVNNILAFFVAILFGGWTNVFVGSDTKGSAVQFLLSLLVHGVALTLIWWQAGRRGLPYLSRPPAPAPTAQLQGWTDPAAAPVAPHA
jgi:membrane protease YdiL (CAAX protease family)